MSSPDLWPWCRSPSLLPSSLTSQVLHALSQNLCPMHLPRREFEALVAQALDEVPDEFRAHLDNVEIVVEDHPAPEDLEDRDFPQGWLLLGIYRGIPLTQRTVFATSPYPDQIAIFQRPIEQIAHTHEEIVLEVRKTVLHEIAHHFGISDQRLRELGY